MGKAPGFGAMKARKVRRLLESLGYGVVAGSGGSHRRLKCDGRPSLTFAYHDNDEVGGWMVRRILLQAGLSLEEAKEVYRHGK